MIDTVKHLLSRLDRKRDYMETFGTPHGKRVLAHLLEVSGATNPKFAKDANDLLWNEAQRHFALSIFKQVHGSMDVLDEQIKEQIHKLETEK